ncbi:MAG: beta strand repeat-containing protein, partial [Pirellulales bacterium]
PAAINSQSLVWYARSAPSLVGTYTAVGANLTAAGSLVLGPYAQPITVTGATTFAGDITITAPDVVITDPVIAGGSGRSITVAATSGGITIQSKGLLQTTGGPVSLSATKGVSAANAASVTSVVGSELAVSAGGPVVLSTSAPTLGSVSVDGPVTLAVKGPLTQGSGAVLQATSLDITGVGGTIALANGTNNVSKLSVRNGSGSVTYSDVNELVIDTIVAGPVSLTVGTPAVSGPALSQTSSGSITATKLDIVSTARGVQLTNAANDVDSLSVSNPGRLVSFTDKSALSIAGLTAGTVVLSVGGNLTQSTQSAAINVSSLTLTATAGTITLSRSDNNVDWLTATNPSRGVTFTDSDNLAIGGLTGGTMSLTVGGNLTQSAPIVGTSLSVTASAGAVTLNSANNVAAATFTNTTRAVSYTNSGSLALGGLTAGTGSLVLGGDLTQTGPIVGNTLGITSLGTVDLRNAANNLDGLAVDNGSRLFSYADSNNIAITSVGTLSVGTVTAAQLMTVTTTNGGGVDVGPQANGLLQAGSTLDLRAVQGGIGIRNGGRIVGTPVILPTGTSIQVGGAVTTASQLNDAVATVNAQSAIAGATYEILVTQSIGLTQSLSFLRPVTLRGTSKSVIMSGSPSVTSGLLLGSGASGSAVKDITFSGFSGDAIRLTSATGITISAVRLSNSGNGLAMSGASTGTVVQGSIFNRNATGISLTSVTGALIGGQSTGQPNTISNSARDGVFATGFCTGTKIVKNVLSGNANNYNVSTSRNLEIIN